MIVDWAAKGHATERDFLQALLARSLPCQATAAVTSQPRPPIPLPSPLSPLHLSPALSHETSCVKLPHTALLGTRGDEHCGLFLRNALQPPKYRSTMFVSRLGEVTIRPAGRAWSLAGTQGVARRRVSGVQATNHYVPASLNNVNSIRGTLRRNRCGVLTFICRC